MENYLFKIIRLTSNSRNGTHGVILQNNFPCTPAAFLIPFALTSEPPWFDNEPNVSCIPAGDYKCNRVSSPRFGNTFEVLDVPGRTHILFHKGNFKSDTRGCFLIGEQFEAVGVNDCAVLSSKKGFDEFLKRTENVDSFNIRVENNFYLPD